MIQVFSCSSELISFDLESSLMPSLHHPNDAILGFKAALNAQCNRLVKGFCTPLLIEALCSYPF